MGPCQRPIYGGTGAVLPTTCGYGIMDATPKEWAVWLPFPLSSNNLFAHGFAKGRIVRYPTSAYKKWRAEAQVRILSARIPLMREPVIVKLELTPPNARRRDADNFTKGVIDAL